MDEWQELEPPSRGIGGWPLRRFANGIADFVLEQEDRHGTTCYIIYVRRDNYVYLWEEINHPEPKGRICWSAEWDEAIEAAKPLVMEWFVKQALAR